MMSGFQRYVGIDYSGAGVPTAKNSAIQAYSARLGENAIVSCLSAGETWSRAELTRWLVDQTEKPERLLVGIDHAFSFPREEMGDCMSWAEFLGMVRQEWRSDERQMTKAAITERYPDCGRLLRLTEKWTSSAKSVFDGNGPGVACSTFAGLPWLLHIRERCGDRVFFWPFDGWSPPAGKHVIAEVYPSLFRNRYRESGLEGDALDAFAVAQWMKDMDAHGFLDRYFHPPLTAEQKRLARLEGWILGVA